MHTFEYTNKPWSESILKPFFHRTVRIGGNTNTVNVSKYNMKKAYEQRTFKSGHSANYKMVVKFGQTKEEDEQKHSIDAG